MADLFPQSLISEQPGLTFCVAPQRGTVQTLQSRDSFKPLLHPLTPELLSDTPVAPPKHSLNSHGWLSKLR